MNSKIGLWRAFSRDLIWPQLHEQRRPSSILHSQHAAAVSTYATFADYEDIAIALSKFARHALIWMIDGTPLEIEVSQSKGFRARADEEFFNHTCAGPKVRVVVFRSYKQLNYYIKVKRYAERLARPNFAPKWWPVNKKLLLDSCRCLAFEHACTQGSNPGRLIFTTAHLIGRLTAYTSDTLDIGVIFPEESETAYCFQSPFESSEFSRTRTKPEEVKFFRLRPNCRGVPAAQHYDDFISDIIYDRTGLTQWAFDTPEELSEKVKRFEWWRRRALRKSSTLWRDIMGTKEASIVEKFHRFLLITPAVIVIVLGLREALHWCEPWIEALYEWAKHFKT